MSWFKGLEKTRVDIGFESYSPNFYYQNSRVTAVYTADLDRLRALMPAEVLATVQPLQIWPGRGLIAFTAYTYEHCDNDAYNEVAVSIITNTPGKANLGPFTLVGQSMSGDFLRGLGNPHAWRRQPVELHPLLEAWENDEVRICASVPECALRAETTRNPG